MHGITSPLRTVPQHRYSGIILAILSPYHTRQKGNRFNSSNLCLERIRIVLRTQYLPTWDCEFGFLPTLLLAQVLYHLMERLHTLLYQTDVRLQ